MKMQRFSPLFLLSGILLFSYSAKSYNYQQQTYTIYTNKDLESLYAPIIFSSSGIKDFFHHTFNRPEYAQEVLPNYFSHFLQFLEHALRSNKKRIYAKSVIRPFANRLKACPYVNAYVFADMLQQMNELLVTQMRPIMKVENDLTHVVHNLLYSSFSTNFLQFKQRPRLFLDELSHEIIRHLNDYYLQDSSVEELRTMVLRFLEIGLSKLIWHPEDSKETWKSVKTIADNLAEFVDSEIISDIEDLNDLYISLLERYIFFLDISNNELPISFYQHVKQDIKESSTILLELEEQEEFLEPKIQKLMHALNIGEAKVRAREPNDRL
ncbi:hypothetical protein E3J79_03825 [Candidatus Dependentiae bacterium]|nr:MAG: hypothetical protein E3J79_03825 [Candidatus Dependentiae bacterium]